MTNLNPGAANVKNLESRAVDTNEDAKIAPRDTTATQGIIHCNNNDDQAVSSDEMSGAVTNFCERTSDTRLFGIASTTYSFPNFSVELSSTVPATGNWSYDVTKCTDSFWQILHSCQASSIDPIKHHGGSNDELNHIWKVSIQKKATDGQDAVSLADHEDVDATAAQRRIVCKGINSPEEITNYLNPAIGDFCRSKAGGQNQGRWVGWFKPANQKIRLSVEGPEVGTFTPGECEEGFFTVRDACHGTVGPGWSKGGVNFDGDWHWYTDIWDSWGDMKS
ncbi:hypothetical protein P152DRAFT_455237 [Eremomyces bilateralis CBS 781.70]|uniref:Uncharacterized protein n=1 Tax=Eremomyces bilateralis CBS 781.70 TaxID=1392243 RepID=A0A6G1GBX3_9PEZI|nr:uncharacterized protein P152DRAFT_455237 [Eremomyces bilateralis CBS 781.70]KAF1815524.1 hypothetical protein P152DRAFT_455237 [Eremomyces bilateralis CBS 781.70]